jgi:superfamily II DNA or RNA helicase
MTLRDYQLPIIEHTLKILREGSGGGLLELYTGSGKTSIAIYLMCALKVKTLIVVHKSFLLQQWVERIKQFAPHARIGVIQGTKFDVKDKDIVIGMLQTLSMKDHDDEAAFGDIGFVCVDETHHIGAEVFCRALPKIASRYMIGLSATPTRKDGLTKVIHWFMGDTAYRLQRNGDDSQTVLVKHITFKSDDMTYKRECRNFKGTVMLPQMLSNIVEYTPRNALIIHEALQYVREDGRQVMIISDRINHLQHLKSILDGVFASDKSKRRVSGLYTGQQKQKELVVSERADIILSSYAMCREGLDIQSLNTIILATSTGDVIQTCGRILRKVHSVLPLVIDIADSFSSFVGQSKKRCMFYKKSGYVVTPFVFSAGQDVSILNVATSDLRQTNVQKKKQLVLRISDGESSSDSDTGDDKQKKAENRYKFVDDEE